MHAQFLSSRAPVASSLLFLVLYVSSANTQPPDRVQLTLNSSVAESRHFVAVHGRQSVVMGYPQKGLEIWGYPFQILSDYQVGFRPSGASAAADGRLLLRRVDYGPDSVTRIYVGPDYLVREKLFVPLNEPAAVISYEVEGLRQLQIEIHFMPVLDLMWPGSLGGQYTRWSEATADTNDVPGFVISEPGRGFSAVIGSREVVTHDDTVNSTVHAESGLSFTLRPYTVHPRAAKPNILAKATVYVALNPAGTKNAAAALQTLASNMPRLEHEAAANYLTLEETSLRIHTPDESVNQSLAWSVAALDQAWVCNSLLGCGMVAGYGPSRDARRPQYAWFFGGDGLVATNALISAGEYPRAKEELNFIQKYQDPVSGMIWHELSQSAGFIDWSKFPYMYVHVDISFDYLATVARYVAVTGDKSFVTDQWPSIAAAYRYCQTQIRESDHLPHIPADKEASDEQHRPADDLGLSASWTDAVSGFAKLARLTGHGQQADTALRELEQARQSIPTRYWNSAKNFWFDGHTEAGEPIFRYASGPTQLIVANVFSPQQNKALLDQLASADFQADWGTREVAASSKDYNPYSYGAGSISALGTTAVATTFWHAHRPESAMGLWNGVVQWSAFDSFGHIHEVLAGNFFHEETESVPEQTWSSAGLLDSTVRGLLGLEIDGFGNAIHLSPHIPAEWDRISVDNMRLPHSVLAFKMRQSMTGIDIDLNNIGAPTTMLFEPQIPLGARLVGAEFQGHAANAEVEMFSSDEHAKLTLKVPPRTSHCHLSINGGVSILVSHAALRVGDPSSELKIVNIQMHGKELSIDADVHSAGGCKLKIRTPWKIAAHRGATIRSLLDDEYEVEIMRSLSPESSATSLSGYTRTHSDYTFDVR